MYSKRRERFIIVGFAVVFVCVILSQIPAVQILYHQTMMNHWKAQGFTPQVDSQNAGSVALFTAMGDKFANYEHHRLQLLRLGALSFARFPLPHPKVSPRTAELQSQLKTQAPSHIDFDYTVGRNYFNLEVYCEPGDLASWRGVVQKHGLLPVP